LRDKTCKVSALRKSVFFDGMKGISMKHALFKAARLSRYWMTAAALVVLTACGGGGGGGGDDGSNNPPPPSNDPPASVFALSISKSGTGAGTVTSAPVGVSCGSTCAASFDRNTIVQLTATPGANQTFDGWGGDCSGAASTCSVTMSQVRNVTARFNASTGQTNYTLTTTVSGTGTISSQPSGISCPGTCGASYAANTTVTLTATPGSGQSFTGWTGACTGSANTCVVSMSQARSVGANFAPIQGTNFALSVAVSGSGRVSSSPTGIDCGATCNANFASGTAVTLTANATGGQVFSGWGGACSGTSNTCVVQMTQARSVQASFAAPPSAVVFQAPALVENLDDFNVARLSSLAGNAGLNSMVAVSPNGNTVVIWEQSDGQPNNSTYKAWMRRYLTGSGWQAAEVIPDLTASSLLSGMVNGRLYMDDAGRVTWLKGGTGIVTRRYTPGSGWTTVAAPTGIAGFFTDLLQGVMDAQGNVGILIRVGSVGMYNASLQAGGGWTTPVRLDQRAAGLSYSGGDIALSSNGTAIAIWAQENAGGSIDDLFASRYTAATGWGTPERIENSVGDVQSAGRSAMRMVMDGQGNGIAMWQQGTQLFYNLYRVGAGWQGAVLFETINTSSSTSNSFISLEMNESGQAVATWFAGVVTFRSMTYSPTGGWSAVSDITESFDNPGQLSLASAKLGLTADGRAYLVGEGLLVAGPTYRIKESSAAWGTSVNLTTGISGVEDIYFTMNRAGQGIVVWSRDDQLNVNTRNSLWSSLLR
jgi:hypothetical protein